ncbi:MAG: hypothetical protein IT496_01595 [Gammaproteobacteria bacterium]|nr:hypothetical protein [Gammaproteobacteria bacterium]MCG3144245.1 hypothetical protein [Gammaproteobacteria bacterium]
MKLGEAVKLFAAHCLWRVTGAKSAGRVLIRGLTSSEENNRLIAGMLLVRSGAKASPLYREALERGSPPPLLLRVIGDGGVRDLHSQIARYLDSNDPNVARAAAYALDALKRS